MHEYLFDAKLFASIRVTADNETAAREKLKAMLDCADLVIEGATGEVSLDSEDGAELMEVDGEDPEAGE